VIGAGNPGMAVGGMGDLLTGVIAALRAQGMPAFDAACIGALLHASAGDEAARDGGERGFVAVGFVAAVCVASRILTRSLDARLPAHARRYRSRCRGLRATRVRRARSCICAAIWARASRRSRAALLRALGVRGAIRSPTYTLVERYPLDDGGDALHLDLYRIGDPGELEFLGLDAGEGALWLVEWPERGGRALPPADIDLLLALEGDGRSFDAVAGSPVGRRVVVPFGRLPRLACVCSPSLRGTVAGAG
jgi:tRNA threonylcarbamoyl adenosine modification protein YjeE